MSITIKVECSPGSEITEVFQEVIELSNRMQVALEFDFNGVTCFVKPGGSVKKGVEQWNVAMSSKSQYKFARSY